MMAEEQKKSKKFFQYSENDLARAINDVKNGNSSIRQAERTYNVPHSTLINKLKGRTPETRKMGPATILTKEEEDILVRWINASAKKGFPLNKNLLCETVKDIVSNDGRPNPFKDGLPGNKWFNAFLKRHPEVSQRHAESINAARASVSEASIRDWHKEIRVFLAGQNAEDILEDPSRIFNSDESGFATNPKSGLVLGPKGMKNFYEIKTGSEKECITALFTISADGKIYPPMIVVPYERIPAEISRNTNPDWVIGRSKKGWMTSQTFHSYVCNTFLPYLKKNSVKFPILYFLDGHKSHLTYHLSKFCAENGIFLFALYPNATHILQPADVSLFAPLKGNWKTVVLNWKRANNNKQVNKATFPLLLENATQQVTAETIKNGFRKCGLYPYDVEAIDFKKCMKDASRILGENKENNEHKVKPAEFEIPHFLYFESVIPLKRRQEFKNAEMGEWNGDESAKELFEIWKKLKNRCKNRNIEIENERTERVENEMAREDNTEIEESNITETDETDKESEKTEENTNKTSGEKIHNITDTQEEIEQGANNADAKEDKSFEREKTPEPNTLNVSQKKSISTSFLDHIFWPEETPEKKIQATKKERLPYASTSQRWLQYHENKEKLKIQKEKEKQERALERKRKRDEKQQKSGNKKIPKKNYQKRNIKIKSIYEFSDSEEWSESSVDDKSEEQSDDSDNEPLAKIAEAGKKIREGDFYLVKFPGKKKEHNYVCTILNVLNKNDIEVQAMCPVDEDKSTYKIIDGDISVISKSQLLSKLDQPELIGTENRIKYKFSSDILI